MCLTKNGVTTETSWFGTATGEFELELDGGEGGTSACAFKSFGAESVTIVDLIDEWGGSIDGDPCLDNAGVACLEPDLDAVSSFDDTVELMIWLKLLVVAWGETCSSDAQLFCKFITEGRGDY